MGDERLIGENLMDLDLNQEPVEPPPVSSVERFGFLLNELETAHGRIEERIRQLEAVTARARQRQRWRHTRNNMETSHVMGELPVDLDDEGGIADANNLGNLRRSTGRGESYKRDSSHLVAKALEMNVEVKKVDKEGGSFYDCNICLDLARDPVLTCCGHLFCWSCFYQVSYIDLTCKECPVCKGEVSDHTVTPIYGNGSSEHVSELASGLKIPPRPKAHRIESLRQRCLSRGTSHLPVSEALRRIRISLGAMGDQTQPPLGSSVHSFESESQEVQNAEPPRNRRERIQQVSRVLSESAASLSSLSSALSNAERLVEDLETVISNRFLQGDARALSVDVGNPLTRDAAVMQSYQPPLDSSREVNSTVVLTPPSLSGDVPGSLLHTMLRRNAVNQQVASSSSSRRRSLMARIYDARISDNDSRDSRESRRRRLN